MNRHVTDAEWTAARATPCGMCGQPYHRYCYHDPEHEWDGVACINSLRAEVEKLRAERTALRVEFDALSDHARHLRAGLEAWAAASSTLEAQP